ncbi:radical SAM protein [Spongiactinospora rosea]|uniref:radical SAM protein n=1 Tax=Spongiactinospora rosea TaxID=2248750 RepID=UPI001CECC059|nr:radical SAM protein [Spongiactinospora rosea]
MTHHGGRARYDLRFASRPRALIIQPTTLCNLDCGYCYLPHRRLRNEMPVEVSRAIAISVEMMAEMEHPLEIVWHGGEPLVLGVRKFTALLEPFEELRRAGFVSHCVQTNATLINAQWCDLIVAYGIHVGVSIDGPAELNSDRADIAQRPAFDRITQGIALLRERRIPFSAISVVGPQAPAPRGL